MGIAKYFFAFLVFFVFVGCELNDTQNQSLDCSNPYENKDWDIAFCPPANWQVKEIDPNMFQFKVIMDSNTLEINLVKEKAPGYGLEEYYTHNLKSMKANLPKLTIVKDTVREIINEHSFLKMIYQCELNKSPVSFFTYFTTKEKVGYVLSFKMSSPVFESHHTLFEKTAQSFRFI